jgi:putative DNA methylase
MDDGRCPYGLGSDVECIWSILQFGDIDYQLAAYAAALRVLTRYKTIEDLDVAYDLSKPRKRGETSPIEQIIANAVGAAYDFLLPRGFDAFVWKTLTPDERFYLKGLDLESPGEYRTGAYQELARGFKVKEYKPFSPVVRPIRRD